MGHEFSSVGILYTLITGLSDIVAYTKSWYSKDLLSAEDVTREQRRMMIMETEVGNVGLGVNGS